MALWQHDNGDMPKVLRDMARERAQRSEGSAWFFALLCGAVGLAILLSACAASVQVTGIGATLALDPAKLPAGNPAHLAPMRR